MSKCPGASDLYKIKRAVKWVHKRRRKIKTLKIKDKLNCIKSNSYSQESMTLKVQR